MTILISVLETALPVLAALSLGMLLRRTGFLRPADVEALKKVALNLCLPLVLVSAFATMEYTVTTLMIPLAMFVICLAGLGVGVVLARLMRLDRVCGFLSTGFEAGMLGYALFALLYPRESASTFAILDPGHTLFVFTVYKALLSGSHDLRAMGRDIAASPVIWGLVAGVLLGATGLYGFLADHGLGGTVDAVTDFLSAPTGMLILLCIGYDLDLRSLQWGTLSRLIVLRLISAGAMLGLLLLANRFVLGGMVHTGAAVLFFLLPPPYVLPVFSQDESQRATLSSAISALTLVTILAFAIMAVVV